MYLTRIYKETESHGKIPRAQREKMMLVSADG